MASQYDEIRERFKNDEYVIKCLDEFIEAKEKYLKDRSTSNSIDMKMKFTDIYERIKVAYYCHRYSEEVFLRMKEALQTIE